MLELRILSGLQTGARLKLPDGSYSLGQDESCDVVVREHGVDAFALQLAIDGRRITATPGQPRCGAGLADSQAEGFALTPGQAFHIADLWLVVDGEEAPWPEARSWLEAAAAHDAANSRQEDDLDPEEDEDEDEDEDEEDDDDELDPSRSVAASSTRPKRVGGWLAVGCIATLVGGSALAFAFKPLSQDSPAKLSPQADSQTAPMSTPDMPPSPVAENPAMPPPAPVAAPAPAAASGPTVDEAVDDLKRLLAEHRFDEEIAVEREDKTIRVAGSLDPARAKQLETLLAPLVKKYGGIASISAQVRPVAGRLPFRVSQIVSGPMAHIVTEDGERIFVGGSYKGYRLMTVRNHKVSFAGALPVDIEW